MPTRFDHVYIKAAGYHLPGAPVDNAQMDAYIAPLNNRHPLVPMSTLRAGYRLVLHGLSSEMRHALLTRAKAAQQAAGRTRGEAGAGCATGGHAPVVSGDVG